MRNLFEIMKPIAVIVLIFIAIGGCFAKLEEYDRKQQEAYRQSLEQKQNQIIEKHIEIPNTTIEDAQVKGGSVLKYVRTMKVCLPDMTYTGHVLVDVKTGIEYLYIWGGGYRGGPAITRLWESEEGE
jgi:hypothetical protein